MEIHPKKMPNQSSQRINLNKKLKEIYHRIHTHSYRNEMHRNLDDVDRTKMFTNDDQVEKPNTGGDAFYIIGTRQQKGQRSVHDFGITSR